MGLSCSELFRNSIGHAGWLGTSASRITWPARLFFSYRMTVGSESRGGASARESGSSTAVLLFQCFDRISAIRGVGDPLSSLAHNIIS